MFLARDAFFPGFSQNPGSGSNPGSTENYPGSRYLVQTAVNLEPYSRNGALPGPFSLPFGYEEVLELKNSLSYIKKHTIM